MNTYDTDFHWLVGCVKEFILSAVINFTENIESLSPKCIKLKVFVSVVVSNRSTCYVSNK